MNELEMKALLDRLDEKTTTVCGLNESMRMYDQRWDKFHSLILGFGTPCSESIEDFIKRMVSEYKRLKITERDHADLLSALDEVPLPQEDHESYPAYALRVGDAMRALSDDKSTLQKDLHEARLEHSNDQSIISGLQQHVSNRDARIAQLEKRESELNALHDTIEALPGFPMQPEEKYTEYLQWLAVDRAHHADERSKLFTELEHLKASTAQTLERLRSQIDQNNLQYADERERNRVLTDQLQNTCSGDDLAEALRERDCARRELADALSLLESHKTRRAHVAVQRDEAEAQREHFRAQWDASLKARDSAQDEARRTREANEALRGRLTLHSQVIARLMMQPGTDNVFAEIDWSDAARKVLIDARALCGENGTATA